MALRNALGAVALDATVQSVLTALSNVFTTRNAYATASGTTAAVNAVVDGTTDLSTYAAVRVQVTGTWAGTLTFQVSNDGTTWVTRNLLTATSGLTGTTTSNNVFMGDIGARYFRVAQTAYTSGTATVNILYTAAPATPFTNSTSTTLNNGTGTVGYPASGNAYNLSTAATTNAAVVKSSSGNVFEVTISNPSAAAVNVKLFNTTTAPTVGTTVPVVVLPCPAGATQTYQFGSVGKYFTTGISSAVTGGYATSDTTAVAAGVLVGVTYR